ncbi:uncharacterized protein KIAA1614 [Boleophthalmus pectinirostris]|uniref:uncharacterized protein KIAA1614 n=1 Tax=Boleophthalmus pectinirostris TaxID=150288 RepID=UPI00242BFD95|nr:uncharacterized protein KIAA1614 [Boleophthalmus pectinirostris]XP_055020935.1 uncharacterized protein KIAA1614 [Boleophthalmus pectinirostris]
MKSNSSGTHVLDPVTAGSTSCSSDEDLLEFSSQSDLDSLTFDPCESTADSEVPYPFTGLQEAELLRTNIMSLTQRVQLNRSILQHLLKAPAAEGQGQSERGGENNTGSDLDVSDSEDQQNGNKHSELTSASPLPHSLPLSRACACVRPFMSARLPRQQRCADSARMKRRPEPLRADHNLLAPDARCLPGVRYCAVSQVNSLPTHLNSSSHTQAPSRSTRRRPESSPNRRLRFEDETEREAESRYQERQKRRAGQRGQDILVSKPDVSQYVNGQYKAIGDGQYMGQLGVNLQLHPTPLVYNHQSQILYPVPPARPVISLRTEPIKETYIGVVTYSDSDGGEAGEQMGRRGASNTGVRRRTNNTKQNGLHKQSTLRSDLPINPYAPEQTLTHSHVEVSDQTKVYSSPSFSPSPPALSSATSHNGKRNDTRTDRKHKKSKAKDQKCQNLTEDHTEERASEKQLPPRELQTQGESRVAEGSPEVKFKTSSSSAEDHQILTASTPNGTKRSKQPMRAEHHSPLEPVEGSRLSLRRLFSSVRLGRSRSSSLDRTSSRPCSPGPEPPTGHTKYHGLLKKTPSVQSLTMGSPFLKLRKSASVQSFVSEQKKKDRSENYKPGAQSPLQRCLSVEDVSCPSSVRSVGRILQVYTDGTLLLELSRPHSQTYGFIISRGKGRTDSGVYVEDMLDSSTEKLYAGLLSVGDEILEVNEEKVACLSLDQVTHMLTHSSSVRVRVLRQRKPPSR